MPHLRRLRLSLPAYPALTGWANLWRAYGACMTGCSQPGGEDGAGGEKDPLDSLRSLRVTILGGIVS
jgi:hypothetical protein